MNRLTEFLIEEQQAKRKGSRYSEIDILPSLKEWEYVNDVG